MAADVSSRGGSRLARARARAGAVKRAAGVAAAVAFALLFVVVRHEHPAAAGATSNSTDQVVTPTFDDGGIEPDEDDWGSLSFGGGSDIGSAQRAPQTSTRSS